MIAHVSEPRYNWHSVGFFHPSHNNNHLLLRKLEDPSTVSGAQWLHLTSLRPVLGQSEGLSGKVDERFNSPKGQESVFVA